MSEGATAAVVSEEAEEWRQVSWAPLYDVSNMGRVRSWVRRRFNGRLPEPRMLRPAVLSHGYPCVNIFTAPKTPKTMLIHRLVLEAFVGPSPDGMEACHNNGVRTDARLSNLRWDTKQANSFDRHSHGTWKDPPRSEGPRGMSHVRAGLIKYLANCHDASAENISEWFSVSKPVASKVIRGVTYSKLRRGSDVRQSKLVAGEVILIRMVLRLPDSERPSMVSIARSFGVTDGNIQAIRDRKTWIHV